MDEKKLCLALDGLSLADSIKILQQLKGRCHAVKIHALLDQEGPSVIELLRKYGAAKIWVDYKLHDTPDTVGYRVAALRSYGVDIITVHASGGVNMMREAVKAAGTQTEIWAITALTSLDDGDIRLIYGEDRTRQQVVTDLAYMASVSKASGLVCSAQEVGMLRQEAYLQSNSPNLKLVVPGTRSAGVALGQQKRSGTPRQAILDGATFLVAGSQVTKADDPRSAFDAMEAEISN